MEAAARTAGHNVDEPGELSMTRHGMLQPSAAGTQPPATDRRASMMLIDGNRTASNRASSRKHLAQSPRSSLPPAIPVLPDDGRAIADISRKSKSP
jgi:hypothetical protein